MNERGSPSFYFILTLVVKGRENEKKIRGKEYEIGYPSLLKH